MKQVQNVSKNLIKDYLNTGTTKKAGIIKKNHKRNIFLSKVLGNRPRFVRCNCFADLTFKRCAKTMLDGRGFVLTNLFR